jgi:hypothetical protein
MDLSGNEELQLEIVNTTLDIVVPTRENIVTTNKTYVLTANENLLEKIRVNCVHLSIYHNRRYHFYKNILFSIFRVPLIVLGGFNSFTAVGLQNYIEQRTISLINAMLSLFSAIITSVELLLNLQKRMENELDSYKKYYKLSVEIYTYMRSDSEGRIPTEDVFLKEKHKEYDALIIAGNAINVYRRGFNDRLEFVDGKPVINQDKKITCIEYLQNGCI